MFSDLLDYSYHRNYVKPAILWTEQHFGPVVVIEDVAIIHSYIPCS